MSDIMIVSIYVIGVIVCAALIQLAMLKDQMEPFALLWPLLIFVIPVVSIVFLGKYIGECIRKYICK